MSKDCDVNHREVVCTLIWHLDLDWGQEQYLVAKREMPVNGEPGLGGLYEFPRRKGKSIRSALFPLALYHCHDHPFHCRRSTICHCNHHHISCRSPIVVACKQINYLQVENNETHAAALKREIREELSAEIEVKGYCMDPYIFSYNKSKSKHGFGGTFKLIPMLCVLKDDSPVPKEKDGIHLIVCWVDDYLLAEISMVCGDGAIKQNIEIEAVAGSWLASVGDEVGIKEIVRQRGKPAKKFI